MNDDGKYGFSKPENVTAARAKLNHILALHEARRAHEAAAEQQTTAPEDVAIPLPLAQPEEVVDFTDGTWIEERLPVIEVLIERQRPGLPDIRRELITSRYTSTWRKREPSDEDAAFIMLPAKFTPPPEPTRVSLPGWGQGHDRQLVGGRIGAAIRQEQEQARSRQRRGWLRIANRD